jgi:DNA-directed RNA polymerase specialized sigma24 family protein
VSRAGQATAAAREYASSEDFCAVFREQMNRLYFLSLLLTGDEGQAEQCFTSSLETCQQSQRIFKDWAPRWATHTVIKTAIRMVSPVRSGDGAKPGSEQQALVTILRQLAPIDRFAYLMTVVERYSDLESATFLGCSAKDVRAARERAMVSLGAHAALWNIQEAAGTLAVSEVVQSAVRKAG